MKKEEKSTGQKLHEFVIHCLVRFGMGALFILSISAALIGGLVVVAAILFGGAWVYDAGWHCLGITIYIVEFLSLGIWCTNDEDWDY